jgi:hypothetical protein
MKLSSSSMEIHVFHTWAREEQERQGDLKPNNPTMFLHSGNT